MNGYYLSVGDILKVIKDNDIPNNVEVFYERIGDHYFNPSTHKTING